MLFTLICTSGLMLYSLQPNSPVHDLDAVVLLDSHVGVLRRIEVYASISRRLSLIVEASDNLIGSQIELTEFFENVFDSCFVA